MKVIYDEFFLRHRAPPGHPHPECPARVSTARRELGGLEVRERSDARCTEDNHRMPHMLQRLVSD